MNHGVNPAIPKETDSAGSTSPTYEIIDGEELAKRLCVPMSWVREYTRTRAPDPIPHLRFGRYRRFRWNSPELNAWLERRKAAGPRTSGRR